jgi:RNA polymerase sigma-70 factor (ECF subfamily)
MLGRFPSVQRWAQTDDVFQNALLRLLRALEQVRPAWVRDFFGLAAEQMRRELLDLARHFHGPHGQAAHHDSAAFHEGVAALPAEERAVVGLVYYHGPTQAAVAELLGAHVRTVQRRWESALLKLRAAMTTQEP